MNLRTGNWNGVSAIRLPVLLYALLTLAACGSGDNPVEDVAAVRAVGPSSQDPLPPEAYSADELLVEFRSDIGSSELEVAGIDTSQAVPAHRNSVLRNDRNCELLAAEIALRLNLQRGSEVYLGSTRIAEFRLGAGQDMQAVLQSIRSEFGEFILSAKQSTLAIPAFEPDDPDYLASGSFGGPQWYLHSMNFDEAWDVSLGEASVMVAVVDSGCNLQHEELAGQVLDPAAAFPEIEADLVNGDASIEDAHGHGTAVCGLLAAATDNGRTLAGAAPGIGVLPIKVTNDWLDFSIGKYLEAGYLAQQLGAGILLQSFTIYGDDQVVHGMLQDLQESGMLLIAAAGNDADGNPNWPAAWPEVLSVGAVDSLGQRSGFSNHSPSVELAAPGEQIRICGHQFNSGSLAYPTQQGTSLAAPLVAAAAGLLWSSRPELESGRVRELLALTGRSSTGFEHAVPVVDAGALLSLSPGLRLPELPGMVLSGSQPLEAAVLLEPDSAELLLGGTLVDSLDTAPWQFTLDTSSSLFSARSLELRSHAGSASFTDSRLVLVDNTPGSYPLSDGAEQAAGSLLYFDAALASQQLRLALENQFLPDWTEQSVRQYGAGRWQRTDLDSASGSQSWYCGELDSLEYDRDEFDCLVTARIDLSTATSPVLRFSQHYNVQDDDFGYDRLSVLASTDNGASWTLLAGDGHPGWFSGYQAEWKSVEIPLDAYIGEQLHICFSLQSDSLLAGEQAGQPEGWWLDEIYVGEAVSGTAQFSLASPLAGSVFGAVNGSNVVAVHPQDVQDVASFRYELDYIPLGADRGEDLRLDSANLAGVNIQISSLTRPNQQFWLHVTALDADDKAGQSLLVPLYLFNRPGDVNADWQVDGADELLLRQSIGLTAADSGWLPWMDWDQDGIVSERDLAPVGYYWEGGS